MEKLLRVLICSLSLSIFGCEPQNIQDSAPVVVQNPVLTKVISEKVSEDRSHKKTEFYYDWYGGGFRTAPITKVRTIYYLFAEDGTYVEVDVLTYGRTKKGDSYSSSEWQM